MLRPSHLALLAGLSTVWLSPALAQSGGHDTDHSHEMSAMDDMSPSTESYLAANDAMHRDMDIEFTGDADVDFARGMIAHHRGAIDMAEVLLEYGEDPEMMALAREIIATQEAEIAVFEGWLERQEADE